VADSPVVKKKRGRPALSPEAYENRLISKAYKAVEKRIDSGEATSAELVHFLRQGSIKEQLELEKLKKENELLRAKTEAIESQKQTQELYTEAISAFRRYSGLPQIEEENLDD
jgi:hypothetical protein